MQTQANVSVQDVIAKPAPSNVAIQDIIAKPVSSNVTIEDTLANPAPLGLLGFGMTTVLLNLHNAGVYELSAMILAMGIFYGGIAQVIAGVLEIKKKNTFGATAFVSYGLFWLTLVGLLVMPKMGWAEASSNGAMIAIC